MTIIGGVLTAETGDALPIRDAEILHAVLNVEPETFAALCAQTPTLSATLSPTLSDDDLAGIEKFARAVFGPEAADRWTRFWEFQAAQASGRQGG